MEISWLGHSCFRLRGRGAAVITDPYSRDSGYSLGRAAADLVTISNDHPNHSAVGELGGSPTVLDGPGEYEVRGLLVTGIRTNTPKSRGAAAARNTAYLIGVDDVTVCHLGDIANPLTTEQVELLKDADVLLVPVGGHCTIGAPEAVELISQIEPKFVVPMHYATEHSTPQLEPVDRFLREMGLGPIEPQPRLSVTRASLPAEPTVVVLEYRR